MVHEIYKKIRMLDTYNPKPSNAIYLGHEEYTKLMNDETVLPYINTFDKDNLLFMGRTVVEVNKETYFKVGFVE